MLKRRRRNKSENRIDIIFHNSGSDWSTYYFTYFNCKTADCVWKEHLFNSILNVKFFSLDIF